MSPTTIIVLLLLFFSVYIAFASMRGDIKGGEARRLVADGAQLVDVRSPAEFASSHIPGAINVPVEALQQRLADVGPKNRTIIVYCASGARSAHAKRVLLAKGFASVRNLGAMESW